MKSDSQQELYPSDSQTVTDIFVEEGQQVSVGDPLIQYDKTKLELELESKDIAVKQAEIELDDAEDQLKKLQNTKPYTTPRPTRQPVATPTPTRRPAATPHPYACSHAYAGAHHAPCGRDFIQPAGRGL